jgi:hypothetical protein
MEDGGELSRQLIDSISPHLLFLPLSTSFISDVNAHPALSDLDVLSLGMVNPGQ